MSEKKLNDNCSLILIWGESEDWMMIDEQNVCIFDMKLKFKMFFESVWV